MSTPITLGRCRSCESDAARRASNALGHYVECAKCGIRTKYWKRPGDAAKDWNKLMGHHTHAKPAKKPGKRPDNHHGGGRR